MNDEKNEYKKLDDSLQNLIMEARKKNYENPYRCTDEQCIRRNQNRDKPNLWRTSFIRDTEKILHLPVYNRLADKTQVFSFYRNDDITRRALHVQLVSRTARTIGAVLGLNLDLIEAIALGHDIGHTPFGHVGEKYLSDLLFNETGIYFNHNVHSVRVLDHLFHRNVSLQTLDGVLCHNGEFEMQEYRPCKDSKSFEQFDKTIDECDTKGSAFIKTLVPMTLEGCVVRICDMIAYLGKDRQDAEIAKIIDKDTPFSSMEIGTANAMIINNLTVDIINNSYGKDYILLSPEYFKDLKTAKKENFEKIYHNPVLSKNYKITIEPMFKTLYYKLLDDVINENKSSVIWRHHIEYIRKNTFWYSEQNGTSFLYEKENPNRIVTDFIASMTDDYFVDLYNYYFPDNKCTVSYKSYFASL